MAQPNLHLRVLKVPSWRIVTPPPVTENQWKKLVVSPQFHQAEFEWNIWEMSLVSQFHGKLEWDFHNCSKNLTRWCLLSKIKACQTQLCLIMCFMCSCVRCCWQAPSGRVDKGSWVSTSCPDCLGDLSTAGHSLGFSDSNESLVFLDARTPGRTCCTTVQWTAW